MTVTANRCDAPTCRAIVLKTDPRTTVRPLLYHLDCWLTLPSQIPEESILFPHEVVRWRTQRAGPRPVKAISRLWCKGEQSFFPVEFTLFGIGCSSCHALLIATSFRLAPSAGSYDAPDLFQTLDE